MCLICGFIYDEAAGIPEEGIAAGTRWEDVPMNWVCPECGAEVPEHDRSFLAVRAEEAAAGILPPVQQPRRR